MKRIYVSSIFRLEKTHQLPGDIGRVYAYDLESGSYLTKPTGVDPGDPGLTMHSSQGRSIGARGVAFYQDQICVAGSNTKFSIYDKTNYKLIHSVDKPETSFLHQIRARHGRLFVASTGNDRRFVFNGWSVEEDEFLGDYRSIIDKYVNPAVSNKWGADRLHFNSIGWDEYGDEHHVYLNASMVFNFTKKSVVYAGDALQSPHDVSFHYSDIIVNSTLSKQTVAIDRDTKKTRIIYTANFGDDPGNPDNNWNSTRCLLVDGDYLIVGAVPVRLIVLRRRHDGTYLQEDVIELSKLEYEAIYDLCADPRDWYI